MPLVEIAGLQPRNGMLCQTPLTKRHEVALKPPVTSEEQRARVAAFNGALQNIFGPHTALLPLSSGRTQYPALSSSACRPLDVFNMSWGGEGVGVRGAQGGEVFIQMVHFHVSNSISSVAIMVVKVEFVSPGHRPIFYRSLKSFGIDKLIALLHRHGVGLFRRFLER